MNKPAAKEPSMDEILSSIRQIIADDDAAPAPSAPKAVESDELPSFAAFDAVEDESEDVVEAASPSADEALALSEEQIVPEEEQAAASTDLDSGLVVPDDIAFSATPEPEPEAQPEPEPAPKAGISESAPMPDPDLSADMAESLLQPATDAAVRSTFAKLGSAVALGGSSVTLEQMIREMMRPMLKEWLDENLPSMVERIVQAEIERVSRGGGR